MAKPATFGVMHFGIAFGVSDTLTGAVATAGAITLMEPLVNTGAHDFFDRWWAHPRLRAAGTPGGVGPRRRAAPERGS